MSDQRPPNSRVVRYVKLGILSVGLTIVAALLARGVEKVREASDRIS